MRQTHLHFKQGQSRIVLEVGGSSVRENLKFEAFVFKTESVPMKGGKQRQSDQ